MNKSKFSYVICPGNNPKSEFLNQYNTIYSCWQSLWSEAYREMKVDKQLYSDAFTRQDLVGAVFHENKCVALACFRWANTSISAFPNDSYFSLWKESDLKPVSKKGSNVIVCSNLAIHPLARGGGLGVSMLELLTGISLELFKNANADAMTAHIRADRKVNEVCAKWGAELIRPSIHFSGGVTGDFMVFFKEALLAPRSEELALLIKDLWKNRQIISKEFNSQEDLFIDPNLIRKVA